MNEPNQMTLQKKTEILGVELYKAMEIIRYAHTQLREDLIYWLNHPEEHFSNRVITPIKKIRINYKEGGFSLIWYDFEQHSLQMFTAGESKTKTIDNIKEQKGEDREAKEREAENGNKNSV